MPGSAPPGRNHGKPASGPSPATATLGLPDSPPPLSDLNLDFSDLDADTPDHDDAPTHHAPNPASSAKSTTEAARLSELFHRVEALLGKKPVVKEDAFYPECPNSLESSGLTADEVERLMLKYLLSKGSNAGRQIAAQIRLPFALIDPLLKTMKRDQLIALAGSAEMGDYVYAITDLGRERARRYVEECTYFGSAPVCLRDYLKAMEAQTIGGVPATRPDLEEAFSDILVSDEMLDRLGPAINSGRGMFLFGEAGNGKTSIAERITRCFGSTIWIPRTLGIDGEIIRLYDPGLHEEVATTAEAGLFDLSNIDSRWIQIVRPTLIVGGELTMSQLEITLNTQTHICEAPLQLKSNCGTLVIDDFGRQRMPVTELLNRWIVPLEKRYDFLNMPSGKKIQVPFDQLIIFSTNLEPRDLVDGAFLRRIPYKIQVPDPTEEQFREMMRRIAPRLGFQYEEAPVDHLIEKHYRAAKRPFRSCQPRDLLLQVRNYCSYRVIPKRMSAEAFDFAVQNYFSVM
ncbi:MAG: AAA family ATPase [Planctomycetaceae bacterium]|nr:AAA family ATPase [Planctomycetaceae bacterium]